jgi:hypothetical protein
MGKACVDHELHFTISRWIVAMFMFSTRMVRAEIRGFCPTMMVPKLVGFKKPILFGTELRLKNQDIYLGVILDEKLNWNVEQPY